MSLDYFSTIKKIFFIGIGGIGISALAKMVRSRGIEVSGVNDEERPKTLNPLRELGAEIFLLDQVKAELPEADLYVYSDAWIYREPEILKKARTTDKPVLSYFEALGEFAKEYKVIAISGTHGKTTTTAMVAGILVDAGLDPTVIVGSFVKKFNSNFRPGKSEWFVIEADEYNRHFLNFHPYIGVVTNIEADHLDYYKDLDKVPKLSVPGEHNRQNAAAALSVADILKIPETLAQKSLAEFSGTWRRLEKRAETKEGTIIYDDYAHHPTEIRASLHALRELYPKKKITIVFQPHLYSRTKALFGDFTLSFGDAEKVLFLPIYFAREDNDESVSSHKLAQAVRLQGVDAEAMPDFEITEAYVKTLNLGKNDVFVTMGAGEAYKVADKVFNLA